MRAVLARNAFVRIAILYAVCLFLVLAVLGFFLKRFGQSVREGGGLLERRDALTRDVEDLFRDLRETERERVQLARVRPHPEGGLVSFVRGLEIAAARSFVEQKITAVPGVVPPGPESYPSPVVRYRLGVIGPWERFEAYLGELARIPNLIRIESFQMRTSPDGTLFDTGHIEVAIAVSVLDPSAPRPSPAPFVTP